MATGNSLFHITRLISATDITLSARCQNDRRQLLAFVTESGHLSLYYRPTPDQQSILKIIPWYADSTKRISALTFDPSGAWLLVAGHDGTAYIVPALAMVDPAAPIDHRWSTEDITAFPTNLSNTTSLNQQNLNCRISRPTSIAWWQCVMDSQHIAVIGTDRGDIAFVSLTTNQQVGLTYVKSAITVLHVCQDNSLDTVFLLITGEQCNQWTLLLEQRSSGYIWPLNNINNKASDLHSSHSSADMELINRSTTLPTTRSRLQGLKQLSVEKLAILKLRLAEARSKGAKEKDSHMRRGSSSSSSDDSQVRIRKTSNSSEGPDWSSSGPIPDRLSHHVGETFIQPQYARGRYLLSGFFAPNNILTIHGMSLEIVPLFIHKLPPHSHEVLVTDRFLYVVDENRQNLTVVSCQFSEGRLDGDSDYNADSIIDSFNFNGDERILKIYKLNDWSSKARNYNNKSSSSEDRRREKEKEESNSKSAERKSSNHRGSSEERRNRRAGSRSRTSRDREIKNFALPKDVKDLDVEDKLIDTCVIVTTSGIYQVLLKNTAVELFMDLVLKHQELEAAERLALMFGLDLQQLLESAGDLKLADKKFPQAILLYRLSRCRHLKSVLKFAAAGHSKELLSYISMLFATASVELSASERIHLANLAIMAYTDQLLRAVRKSKVLLCKQFLMFLRSNINYDEVVAVNIAGQTGLWEVLQFLASHRGLHLEVLDILSKILKSLLDLVKDGSALSPTSPALDVGLWLCVSNPALIQSLLMKPQLCKTHLSFVTTCLPQLGEFSLKRLAAQFDPSSMVLRPLIKRLLATRRRRNYSVLSNDSFASQSDSVDMSDYSTEEFSSGSLVEEVIHTFLLVLLHLHKQRNKEVTFERHLMERVKPPVNVEVEDLLHQIPLRVNLIGTGFAHTALVRNASLYTWGNAVQGCLGTGPTMSRYSTAQHVSLFPSLKIEVLSVSCGRQHTLALTTNGIYSWGSSQFGQLGLGNIGQTAWPMLVQRLARERVVSISAGQYHSLALTHDGRVYSWGWAVHGQLGHLSVEDCHTPVLINALQGFTIKQISAGHGHSLVLTNDGEVYAFGSSIFGQLGRGSVTKSRIPVKVESLPEPVVNINTNYFHNLAVTESNRLYIWGASPQVLRLQAQAHKKARLMQQHFTQTPTNESIPPILAIDSPSSQSGASDDTNLDLNILSPDLDSFSSKQLESEFKNEVVETFHSKVDVEEVKNSTEMMVLKETDEKVTEDSVSITQNSEQRDQSVSDRRNLINAGKIDELPHENKPAKSSTKKSFTQSVHDYFVEHKISLNDSSHNNQINNTNDNSIGTELSVISKKVTNQIKNEASSAASHSSNALMCTNIRTASSEGYVIPTIIVSPTMEYAKQSTVESPIKKTPPTAANKVLKQPPSYLLDDSNQSHLLPQLVNTSLVVGQILQIACGCHHSALVTNEGILYTWGRNLDGQLGNGGRREVVIPTPLTTIATSSNNVKGGISNAIPTPCDKLRVSQVACGCEYTVALDSQSAKLWAWGSNSQAQLGKAPVEDSKALEGKIVMIKTVKRVIKLPHGSQNSFDTPREVPNLPSCGISFRQTPRDTLLPGGYPNQLVPLLAMDQPCFGSKTLHYTLERLHGHYDSGLLLKRSLELGNYQAAAKLAELDRRLTLALTYQLQALKMSTKSPTNDKTKVDEVKMMGNVVQNIKSTNCHDDGSKIHIEESTIDIDVNIVNVAKETEHIEVEESLKTESNVVEDNNVNAEAPAISNSLYENVDADNSNIDVLISDRKSESQVSSCSTPESVLSSPTNEGSEIHTFSIQGGNEEMSEGRQDLTSPSDATSPVSKDSSIHDDITDIQSVSVTRSVTAEENKTNVLQENDVHDDQEDKPQIALNTGVDDLKLHNHLESIVSKHSEELVVQVSLIMEHYVSQMEDDSHSMMSTILQQGMEFWTCHSLPIEKLESLLLKHMSKFFYPLGLLLFKNSSCDVDGKDSSSMLKHLSTSFCLQLCSALIAHINEHKAYPEYIDLLADTSATKIDRPSDLNGINQAEQLVEAILAKLGSPTALISKPLMEQTLNQSVGLIVLSCGHQCSSSELPVSTDRDHLSCPKCVQQLFSSDVPH